MEQYNRKKSPNVNSNTANNFLSEIAKQLLIANDRNRVRRVVLGLSLDGACIDLFKNHSEKSLKGYLSKDTNVSPPLFSLVNTFNTLVHLLRYSLNIARAGEPSDE
jgi:hypothetical protein